MAFRQCMKPTTCSDQNSKLQWMRNNTKPGTACRTSTLMNGITTISAAAEVQQLPSKIYRQLYWAPAKNGTRPSLGAQRQRPDGPSKLRKAMYRSKAAMSPADRGQGAAFCFAQMGLLLGFGLPEVSLQGTAAFPCSWHLGLKRANCLPIRSAQFRIGFDADAA